MISTSKNQHTGSILQELAWKKLGADPQRLHSFDYHLIQRVKFWGSRLFNFEGRFSIWIHSNIFPGKRFWFYGNLTRNIRDLTGFGGPDIFGNEPARQRKKNRQMLEPVEFINRIWFQVQLPLWTSPNRPGSTITLLAAIQL